MAGELFPSSLLMIIRALLGINSMLNRLIFGLFISLNFSISAIAGISLDATRIIFLSSDERKGQSIGVTSSAESLSPYLIKAQVLKDIQGHSADVPFVVTPSLFRLEQGKTNQIRILKTSGTLPQDRESVFYLRVMAMPAGEKGITTEPTKVEGALTVSTGSIIKLFYRPTSLSMTHQQAMQSLQFSHQGQKLKVTNLSPYFITLSSLKIGNQSVPLSVQKQNTLIAPFSSQTYMTKAVTGQVSWQAINDYGGTEVFHGVIQ